MLAKDAKVGDVIRVAKTVKAVRYENVQVDAGTVGTVNQVLFKGVLLNASLHYLPSNTEVEPELLDKAKALKQFGVYAIGVTSGSDPELFVMDNDRVVPAWMFLPKKGPGSDPQQFWDGVQAEFTTYSSHCLEVLNTYTRDGLLAVYTRAGRSSKAAKLTHQCVVDVPQAILKSASDKHIALGCAPSQNVYGVEPLSVNGRQLPFRFAGCHMHFGLPRPLNFERMVKTADRLYGIASVSLLEGLEDRRRRLFYGKAGEYRLPAHGLEYRVPSSATLRHPVIWMLSFDLARFAVTHPYFEALDVSDQEVQRIVNELDVSSARALMHEQWDVWATALKQMYAPDTRQKAARLLQEGALNCLSMTNMEQDWWLEDVRPSANYSVATAVLT